MAKTAQRDVEKDYPLPDFVAKLRRLANAPRMASASRSQLPASGSTYPARAAINVEHERDGDTEEIEFQLSWKRDAA